MDSPREQPPYYLWFRMAGTSHRWERLSDFFPDLPGPLEIVGIGWKPANRIPVDELMDMLHPDEDGKQGAVVQVFVASVPCLCVPMYRVPGSFAVDGGVSTSRRLPLGTGLRVRPEDEVKVEISGVDDRIEKFRDSILFLLMRPPKEGP